MSSSHRDRQAAVEVGRVLPLHVDRPRAHPPRFAGFQQMAFSARTRWDYAWRETGFTNGKPDPLKSGVVRIALSDPVDVDFGPVGTVTMFEATCSAKSGSVPAWWPQWRSLGFLDGALYGAAELENGEHGAAVLFDSRTGQVHPQGFMGRFSNAPRSVALASISTAFHEGFAVVVEEPSVARGCEVIGGVEISDGEVHDYRVREFYLPGKGFGGWSLRGNSIYAGGGYVDFFEIDVEVGLVLASL